MQALRFIAAVILAILAVLLIVGHIFFILDPEPMQTSDHILLVSIEICVAVTSYYFFRSRAYWEALIPCPECRQRGSMRLSALGQPRVTLLSWLLGSFLGLFYKFHARKQRCHCDACNHTNDVRTPETWLSTMWVLPLIIFCIASYISYRAEK